MGDDVQSYYLCDIFATLTMAGEQSRSYQGRKCHERFFHLDVKKAKVIAITISRFAIIFTRDENIWGRLQWCSQSLCNCCCLGGEQSAVVTCGTRGIQNVYTKRQSKTSYDLCGGYHAWPKTVLFQKCWCLEEP